MKKLLFLCGFAMSLIAGQVSAALPTAATDAITAVTTDATAMIAAVWPVVVAIVVGFALITIFKRGISKAIGG